VPPAGTILYLQRALGPMGVVSDDFVPARRNPWIVEAFSSRTATVNGRRVYRPGCMEAVVRSLRTGTRDRVPIWLLRLSLTLLEDFPRREDSASRNHTA
jgi:hypothetical protein